MSDFGYDTHFYPQNSFGYASDSSDDDDDFGFGSSFGYSSDSSDDGDFDFGSSFGYDESDSEDEFGFGKKGPGRPKKKRGPGRPPKKKYSYKKKALSHTRHATIMRRVMVFAHQMGLSRARSKTAKSRIMKAAWRKAKSKRRRR